MSRKRRRGWVMAALSFIVLIVSLVHADHTPRRGRRAAPPTEVHAPADAVAPTVGPASASAGAQDRKSAEEERRCPVVGVVAKLFE